MFSVCFICCPGNVYFPFNKRNLSFILILLDKYLGSCVATALKFVLFLHKNITNANSVSVRRRVWQKTNRRCAVQISHIFSSGTACSVIVCVVLLRRQRLLHNRDVFRSKFSSRRFALFCCHNHFVLLWWRQSVVDLRSGFVWINRFELTWQELLFFIASFSSKLTFAA